MSNWGDGKLGTRHLSSLDLKLIHLLLLKLLLLEDLVLLLNLVEVFVAAVLKVFLQLTETGPIRLIEFQHHLHNLTKLGAVTQSLPQSINTLSDELLSIELLTLLVEASHVLHRSELEKQQANREHIRLVDVVFRETRIAIHNVRFPQDRR